MKKQHWQKSITLFLLAQTISLLGSSLVQYAIIWHITLTSASGKMLAISTLCGFVPQILISLFAGVWVDRYNRKKMIMLSDSVIAAATLALAGAFFMGHEDIWLLFAVLVVRSVGTGIQMPAVNAVIPQIVPQEHLMSINGINSTLSSLVMFLSPALSGAVLSVASLQATLLVDVATALIGVSVTAAATIRPHERKAEGALSKIAELKAGFSFLKKSRFLKRLLAFQVVILFFISPSAFLTPLMVSRTFGAEVWRLTASETTYSLGMILGGLFIASRGGMKDKMDAAMIAGAVYGMLMLGLGFAPIFFAYLLCNAMVGITTPCYNAPITATIQEKFAPDMQGRIFGFMQMATSCALPLGMIFFGPLADIIQVQQMLIGSGCLILLISCFMWKIRFFTETER